MNWRLSNRQHMVMSVGLLLLCLTILYISLIMPALSNRQTFSDRLEELQFQFSKFSRSAAQTDQLKQELEQLKNTETDRAGFLQDKSEALAAADLQKHIKTLIGINGGNVVSTQVIQRRHNDRSAQGYMEVESSRQLDNEAGVFPQVTIKVHMRSDIEALQKTLHQLGTDQMVLLIDNMFIQKRHQARGRRVTRGKDQMEVRFDITGFIYQQGKS